MAVTSLIKFSGHNFRLSLRDNLFQDVGGKVFKKFPTFKTDFAAPLGSCPLLVGSVGPVVKPLNLDLVGS